MNHLRLCPLYVIPKRPATSTNLRPTPLRMRARARSLVGVLLVGGRVVVFPLRALMSACSPSIHLPAPCPTLPTVCPASLRPALPNPHVQYTRSRPQRQRRSATMTRPGSTIQPSLPFDCRVFASSYCLYTPHLAPSHRIQQRLLLPAVSTPEHPLSRRPSCPP